MDNIFQTEAVHHINGDSIVAELELPLGPYGLLDAMERLRARDPREVEAEVLRFHDYEYLYPVLRGPKELEKLNTLAVRLSELNTRQRTALQGLVKMEKAPITLQRLWCLSNNVDSCHVVDEATNDFQLGRFYAENGFIPELDGMQDSAFDLLDFERIGREARLKEGGVFTKNGYVVQHEELQQVSFPNKGLLHKPEYVFYLTLGVCRTEEVGPFKPQAKLELPTSYGKIQAILHQLGNPQPEILVIDSYDGAIPALPSRIECFNGLCQLNDLALAVQSVVKQGELSKYNAVLEATQCGDVDQMIETAYHLGEYIFESQKKTVEDVARDELKFALGLSERDAAMMRRHLNLQRYGQDLLEGHNAVLTSYGVVVRQNGQPIQTQESSDHQIGGMEMM